MQNKFNTRKIVECALLYACLGAFVPSIRVSFLTFQVFAQEYHHGPNGRHPGEASFRKEQMRKEQEYQRKQRQGERKQRQDQRKQKYEENSFQEGDDRRSGKTWKQIGQFVSSVGPRHIVQGLKTGILSATVGVVSALGFLLGTPYLLSSMGWPGIIVGLIFGGLGSAGTLLIGFGTAAVSVAIGLWKTPQAIYASWFQRKKWDSDEREWMFYTLDEEAETILNSETARTSVSDSTYYDVLGIKPGSSSKDIKRAYFAKAKVVHPDKNPDDEEAANEFIQLHKAYQTLSDPQLREEYDQWGSSSSSSDESFNVEVFFEILFGSQIVEPYIGQLAVASFVNKLRSLSHLSSDDGSQTTVNLDSFWENSKLQTKKRSVQVAQHLRERIQRFVNKTISVEDFLEGCAKEADEIAATGFGEIFLVHIGTALVQEADLYLQKNLLQFPLWLYSSVSKKARSVKSTVGGLKLFAALCVDIFAIKTDTDHKMKENVQITEEDVDKFLPQILELAWAYNARDIASLIEKASFKVLNDSKGTSTSERKRRAKALKLLGQTFAERGLSTNEKNQSNQHSIVNDTCQDSDLTKYDFKARLHVAYQAALSRDSKASSEESEELIRRAKQENHHS